MKKNFILITGAMVILSMASCQKVSEIDFENVLNLNISMEKNDLQPGNSNILTLTIENTSAKKVKLPESAFLIEFTSYSGSIRKIFYFDPFEEKISSEILSQDIIQIKAKSVFTKEIDLSKVLYELTPSEQALLPEDEYTVNLIINLEPKMTTLGNKEIIRSNYADINIKG
jgi:hypothetical protein